MNLGQSPQHRQVQAQKITARLIQSIGLLQYSQAELERFLADQSERNPFLEVRLPEERSGTAVQERAGKGVEAISGLAVPNWPLPASRPASAHFSEDFSGIETTVAARPSLAAHLHTQLGGAFREPVDRMIAMEIIGSLDDDGYLRREPGQIADALHVSLRRLEAVLREVQKMDPPGVAARDLQECLRLQLIDKGWLTLEMDTLIDHLPLLANHDYRRLATLCRVSPQEVLAMAERIRSLDPRPGLRFDSEPVIPALADVLVRQTADGTFVTELNSRVLPRVLVNSQYSSEIRAVCAGAAEARFVTECVRNANWLVKNLDQRARTILRVATEIVRHQQMFLQHGVEHLRPLNLRDVAEALHIHQSTVCRAIANKYMMTSRGLFELSYFFANPVPASEGNEDVSAEAVRHSIRQLIGGESADKVLSDDAIVQKLRETGVNIARRTVAKYREAMNIPSSLQRRRLKLAQQGTAVAA